jgi:hypothetical protein
MTKQASVQLMSKIQATHTSATEATRTQGPYNAESCGKQFVEQSTLLFTPRNLYLNAIGLLPVVLQTLWLPVLQIAS